jgi:hypothetical protein
MRSVVLEGVLPLRDLLVVIDKPDKFPVAKAMLRFAWEWRLAAKVRDEGDGVLVAVLCREFELV